MTCSQCLSSIPNASKFCPECGHRLAESPVATVATQPSATPAEGERRQLTVMFCDVVNSTALSEALDPEDLRDIMRLYHEVCEKVIRRYDGFIAKYLGDGLLVHFGYPTAHEDDAQRAVRAGLGMLEAIRFTEFRDSKRKPVPIEIRIGIHTGLVVIDEIGAADDKKMDIIGETPNIAARLMSLAEPSALVVSASTYRLVSGFFEEEDLGLKEIRGISQPIGVYRIVHEISARTRLEARGLEGLTPLVGRNDELEFLKTQWKEVVEGGGRTALICGEAGIGKSRITSALKLHITQTHDAWLSEGECSPYHQNTAFYPISQFLQHTVLAFETADDAATRYAKLEGFLAQNGFDVAENISLLAPILSLPPNPAFPPLDPLAMSTRQKTMTLLLNLLMHRATMQPTLFILEDLHWADPSTIELIGQIIEESSVVPSASRGARLMIFLTFRPEFTPPWLARNNVHMLTLGRLEQNQTREIIDFLVNYKKIPEHIAEQILRKTDGVPLFVEELTKTVLETGNFVLVGDDRYEVQGQLDDFQIPATLKDSLTARLDRLPASKALAQTAATIGREFTYDLLAAVAKIDSATLRKELSALADAGLIQQRGSLANASYIFKHALVQEAAYESQLKSRRQEIHRQINAAIVTQFPEIAAAQPETLAIHYSEAGMMAEAIAEWLRAGQQAASRAALQEAIVHYYRGIELLASIDETSPARAYELPLQLMLGIALLMTKGYSSPEVAPPLARARELCPLDHPMRPIVLWSLWAYYLVRGDHNESWPLADELWNLGTDRLAATATDNDPIIEASFMQLIEHTVCKGDFRRAAEDLRRVEELYTPALNACTVTGYVQDPLICTLSWGAWVEWWLGRPDRATSVAARNVAYTHELRHTYSGAYSGVCLGTLAVMMEDVATAEQIASETIKVTGERGYPFLHGINMFIQGWVKGRTTDDLAGSMALFEQATALWTAIGSIFWRTLPFTWKIEIQIRHLDLAGASASLDQAYNEAHQIGEVFMLPVLKRLEAELILAQAATPQDDAPLATGASHYELAENLLHESIAMARRFEARSFELPALLELYRLPEAARKTLDTALLSEIAESVAAFTGDLSLPLLQRARAVLDAGFKPQPAAHL